MRRSLFLPAATISFSVVLDEKCRRRRSSPSLRSTEGEASHTSPLISTSLVNSATNSPTERTSREQFLNELNYSSAKFENSKSGEMSWGCAGKCATRVEPLNADSPAILHRNRSGALGDEAHEGESIGGDVSPAPPKDNLSSGQYEELIMKESADRDAPLVILFGWAGCRDRYLSKYSEYYEKEGYSVARFTAPIKRIRSFSSYRQFALEIYEKIIELNCRRPIIIHMFSMNGCSLFAALWDLLENVPDGMDIKARVKGLVFDSSPANVMPWQAANAVSFAMFPPQKANSIPREAYRAALTGILSVHRALVWLHSNFNAQSYETHFAYFRMKRFTDLPKNQLFLYSDADDICVRRSIEEFSREQRNDHNVQIREKCWPDSEHCQHYRRYAADYRRLCVEFVEDSAK